jgi:undecaprenyl diphosphate synthase
MGLGRKVDDTPSVAVRGLPAHVAIIMDGNGRWAEQHGAPRTEGHRQGGETVRRIVRACRRLGIPHLTLYAFSEQNWNRPHVEVRSLMALLQQFLVSERHEILHHHIRLRTIGRIERLPANVRALLTALEHDSDTHHGMTLTLALSYGGREEITDAARTLAERVRAGELAPDAITEERFAAELPSMRGGPVDLLIRTGDEQRISNFLPWGAAYAELYFSHKLWPEFSEVDLFAALHAFQSRQRRFGRVQPARDERELTERSASTPVEPSVETPEDPHADRASARGASSSAAHAF